MNIKKFIIYLLIAILLSASPFLVSANSAGWDGIWENGGNRIIIINGGLRVCVETPEGYYLLLVESADEEIIYGTISGNPVRYEIKKTENNILQFISAVADSGTYTRRTGNNLAAYETALSGLSIVPETAPGGGINVIYNRRYLSFDVAPQIVNGRTMVPLRTIFEAMGAEIEWDGVTQTVTATKGNTVVVLTVGSTSPTVNGETVTIDQPGIIVDGRTLAPLRFVAEAFGGTVEWDGNTQTASIIN